MAQERSEARNRSNGKVLYFEWARCIAAAAVVMIHVTLGIMDNYPVSEVGQTVLDVSCRTHELRD